MITNNEINFYKMEGTGNDFVVINKKIALTTEQITLICNRHYGIGCDQLIIIANIKNEIVKIKIFNSDGSQAFSCGNGIRCVGLLMKILHDKNELKVQVVGGNLTYTKVNKMYNKMRGVIYAELGPYNIIQTDDGHIVEIGNKHLIVVLDKISDADMGYGEYLSKKLDLNVSFVEMYNSRAKVLVYERGAGITNGCGSAAAAIHVAKYQTTETEIFFTNSGERIIAGNINQIGVYIIADAKLAFSGIFYLNNVIDGIS